MTRDRILARRALFVAGLSLSGCRTATPSHPAPPSTDAGAEEESTLIGPPQPCLSIVPHAATVIRSTFTFARGSSALSPNALVELHRIRDALVAEPALRLLIRGHCEEGEPKDLGLLRARAARDWLVAHGVAESRLRILDAGTTANVGPGSQEANRRVELDLE